MTGPSPAAAIARRRLLQFLAASPLLPAAALAQSPGAGDIVISDPRQALNVLDFEPAMRKAVRPAHYGYMATGIDDDRTLRANREGFRHFALRPRRLVDVSRIDAGITLFGRRWDSPIAIAPTASNRAFHADGEIAVARAARAGNHLQMLSTVATTSIEDAIAARGAPVWFQLYPTDSWTVAAGLATRAERAGCEVIVVTVDAIARPQWETMRRFWRADDMRQCGGCHTGLSLRDYVARKPNFDGLDLAGIGTTMHTTVTWDVLRRLRDTVKARLVLKGILAPQDAALAVEAGVDGIIVSTHGGRVEDSGRGSIEALPDIVAAVGGRLPILIDSGFRRGTEIATALALGASAVAIGRPYLWGLGAFGQEGVERVLELLRTELRAAMQQLGAPTVAHLKPEMVVRL